MNLLKAATTVSGFTLLSRVTGLARELITATFFGASALTDAFFVAFRLPNLLRRLFAEGAFSQAFMPMLSQVKLEGGPQEHRALINKVGSALFWAVLIVTLIGIITAPLLVYFMASGLARDPQAFDAAVIMTRWMFPYILMISLVALASGILNTWKQFALPAFTPVLLNLSFIACSLGLSNFFNPPIYALAAGVVLGGIAQLLIQIPALVKLGLLPRLNLNPLTAFKEPEVKKVMSMMAPALLSVSVAQISLVINTQIASRLAPGSVSWITYADRLMEFPTAMLGVALGVVLIPSLSKAHHSGNHDQYSALLDWGLRIVVLLALPCMVGLALMAEPLTAILFHYGKFSALDLAKTQAAVAAYGAGILGLVAIKILAPGFFARQDTRTPVKISLVVLVVTQILNWLFVPHLAHVGLTLSIALGAVLNASWMLFELLRQKAYRPLPGWLLYGLQVLAAIAVMAFALSLAQGRIDWPALQNQWLKRIGLTFGLIGAASAIYVGTLLMLGVTPQEFTQRGKALDTDPT